MTDTQPNRVEALRAAAADSHYLISPTARARTWRQLSGDDSAEADAARLILMTGAQQQGSTQYGSADMTMAEWAIAADILAPFEIVNERVTP